MRALCFGEVFDQHSQELERSNGSADSDDDNAVLWHSFQYEDLALSK